MLKPVRNKCCLLLFVLLFLEVPYGRSQQRKEFYFNHIKTEQGLSNGIINDMLRDKAGYLWIATLNGLNCFDGFHFIVWKANPRDSTQLFNDAIYSVCEDTSLDIWCTSNAGVSRYNRRRNTFSNYWLVNAVTSEHAIGSSNGIICTRKGAIVTYANKGVFVYDRQTDKFIHYPEVKSTGKLDAPGVINKSFVEDPYRNGVWLGTSGGLKYFDLDSRTYFSYSNNPEQLEIFNNHYTGPVCIDAKKNLVFADADEQEIKTFSFRTKKLTSVSTKNWSDRQLYFDCMLVDRDGNIWSSADNIDVFFYEGNSKKVYEIRHRNELSHSIAGDYFISAFQDLNGTVYLGTVNGISYLNLKRDFISVYRFPEQVSHNRKYYLHQLLDCDFQDNIWFAPSYRSLLKYNTRDQSYTSYDILKNLHRRGEDDIDISAMAPGKDKLYFGTIDGLYVFDTRTGQFNKWKGIPDYENVEGHFILNMVLAADNELWFTSHHNGLFRINIQTGEYRHYTHDSTDAGSFTGEYIFDMEADRSGNIWFLAEHDGIIKYDPAGDNFKYLTRDRPGPDPDIYFSFTSDSENNLWVLGFLSGLNKFNTRTNAFETGVHFNGLSNFQYNHLVADDRDRLWLSYYSQYSVLDTRSGSVKNFQVDLARPNNDYANYSCKMTDGRIVTESRNSFFIFSPELSGSDSSLEPVTISNFSAGQSLELFVPDQAKIRLGSSQNFFSFDFSTLSLLNNNDIEFSYKLDGISDDWINCGRRQTANFTNINGGNYVFRVRARNANGRWMESLSPVSIEIDKVFYATVWFKILLFAILGVCVFWYIRYLRRRTLRKEADKAISYFANSMHGKNKVEDLLWDITHNVITRTNLVDCVVYLLDEKRNMLVQKAAYGDKNPAEYEIVNRMEIPVGQGIVGNVALTGKAERVPDTSADPRYIADDSSRLSELAVPILYEGKVIGVIDSEHPKKNFFTRDHLRLLQTIASISGTKITNAKKEMEIAENEKRLEDLKTQIARARQQALQAQMNPHFIFNCLNSINGFILKNDSDAASAFLIKFSRLIRLILEHSNEKSISLQSELEALKLYIEIETLRFEKKFTYEINVESGVMPELVMVPPLIFQPFVENSIWHGLLHRDTGGKLQIHISRNKDVLECFIEDNGVGRDISASLKSSARARKKSLGLKLTNERLALLNQQDNPGSSVNVLDLKDQEGLPCGTRVVISISLSNRFN